MHAKFFNGWQRIHWVYKKNNSMRILRVPSYAWRTNKRGMGKECLMPEWMTLKQLLNLSEMQKFQTRQLQKRKLTNETMARQGFVLQIEWTKQQECRKKKTKKKQQKSDHTHSFVLSMF